MNKVILIGRLTKDPEIRYTQTSKAVANFTIAVSRRFKKDEADFINCVAWEKTAEFISKYFSKGGMIAVVGSIQTRTWEDSEGKKRYITEVIADEAYFAGSKSKTETDKATDTWPPDYGDDDLPF